MLDSKLGITDEAELAREEERISKQKAVLLFQNNMPDAYKSGTFETLAFIHKWLFGEVYDFAEEIRTVNLAKGNFRFAPVMYLEAALAHAEKMPQSAFDEIVEKYVEMNAVHPFREGNGRSTFISLPRRKAPCPPCSCGGWRNRRFTAHGILSRPSARTAWCMTWWTAISA